MDLRIYMKSGNSYYVDVSEYTYDEIYKNLTNSIMYEDSCTIDAYGKSYFFKADDIEYFELDLLDETINKLSNKIGF